MSDKGRQARRTEGVQVCGNVGGKSNSSWRRHDVHGQSRRIKESRDVAAPATGQVHPAGEEPVPRLFDVHRCDPGGEELPREGGSLEDPWQVQLIDLVGALVHDENPFRRVINGYPSWDRGWQTADVEVQDG